MGGRETAEEKWGDLHSLEKEEMGIVVLSFYSLSLLNFCFFFILTLSFSQFSG